MKRFIKKIINRVFYGTRLRTKMAVSFLFVAIVPMVLLLVWSYEMMDKRLMEDARQTVERNLKFAWTQYYARGEQRRYGMLQAAASEFFHHEIAAGDRRRLRENMANWRNFRPYVDLWLVVDKNKRVIARLASASAGDVFDVNSLVARAIDSGDAIISTEVVPREALLKEGGALAEAARIPAADATAVEDGLMLMVSTPVFGKDGAVVGAIVIGDLINNDTFIPDTLAEKIPDTFTAIMMNGVSVATDIKDGKGRRYSGWSLPAAVVSELNAKKGWRGDIEIGGQKYISAVDPIEDGRGRVIGSISSNVLKSRFWELQRRNSRIIVAAGVMGIILAGAFAILATYSISKPITLLRRKTLRFAKGQEDDGAADIPENSAEEFGVLIRTFEQMTRELRVRDSERTGYLNEIEGKNSELAGLNERLGNANEELEVSLEETQSQAEELQCANEELRVLNEEMEQRTRKLAHQNKEISSLQQRLGTIVDGIKDYILLLDRDYTIIEVNQSFLRDRGLKAEDVIGKKCYRMVCDWTSVPDGCIVRQTIMDPVPHSEVKPHSHDKRVFQRFTFPLKDDNGTLTHIIEYIRDVTEETKLRESLLHSERLSSIGHLTAGVAHELNNPLTGIMGFSRILMGKETDEAKKERLRIIYNESLRCKKIIQDLLTFSRGRVAEKVSTDISRLVEETFSLMDYQLKADNIKVSTALDRALPETMVDPFQIKQVLINLINNSHDAMKEKEGERCISVATRAGDGRVIIEFRDTGHGISAENRKEIFTPFFTTKGGKGTGLGLSISYGIIKDHGGTIAVDSKEGEGSVFTIEMPMVRPAASGAGRAAEPEEPVAPATQKGGNAILVLDDEFVVREIVKEACKDLGFEVETANVAEDALDMLSRREYELIITDLKMAGMGGKLFYQELKRRKPGLAKRVVFMSGDTASDATQEFLKDAGNPFIAKPFTIPEFQERISEYIKRLNGEA
ncbi:MAG: response regulator [Deltaproteobacteria bacterium]|nr:response regulator [Deltaproteobacteria bacterium]